VKTHRARRVCLVRGSSCCDSTRRAVRGYAIHTEHIKSQFDAKVQHSTFVECFVMMVWYWNSDWCMFVFVCVCVCVCFLKGRLYYVKYLGRYIHVCIHALVIIPYSVRG